jgi:hypothetical protein
VVLIAQCASDARAVDQCCRSSDPSVSRFIAKTPARKPKAEAHVADALWATVPKEWSRMEEDGGQLAGVAGSPATRLAWPLAQDLAFAEPIRFGVSKNWPCGRFSAPRATIPYAQRASANLGARAWSAFRRLPHCSTQAGVS